jgi:hypothetical protein
MVLQQQKNTCRLRSEIMEKLLVASNEQLLSELDPKGQNNFDISTPILSPPPLNLLVMYKGLI